MQPITLNPSPLSRIGRRKPLSDPTSVFRFHTISRWLANILLTLWRTFCHMSPMGERFALKVSSCYYSRSGSLTICSAMYSLWSLQWPSCDEIFPRIIYSVFLARRCFPVWQSWRMESLFSYRNGPLPGFEDNVLRFEWLQARQPQYSSRSPCSISRPGQGT
jgi:hypothetical protein